MNEKLAIKVTMDFWAISAHKFRTSFWFKHYEVILAEEQSELSKNVELIWWRKYGNTI